MNSDLVRGVFYLMNGQEIYWIWLSKLGLSLKKMAELATLFDYPEELYKASHSTLLYLGVDNATVKILANKNLSKANAILEYCTNNNIQLLCFGDDEYPELLKEIIDFPIVLYVKGDKSVMSSTLPLSMVGSRRPSIYATKTAEKFSFDIASSGMTIVSGMARGIDTICHKGAIRAGKPTIAVLGCGVDVTYPAENEDIKLAIEQNGCVISEFPPGTPPLHTNFPVRNRIISGISLGTFVVEGTLKSGSMITVRMAQEQGREVFTVPTNIDNIRGEGNNLLIQQGAKMVLKVSDVLEEFALSYTDRVNEVLSDREKTYDVLEQSIIDVLNNSVPVNVDEICLVTKQSASVVNSKLTLLEVNGRVKRLPGKNYVLK